MMLTRACHLALLVCCVAAAPLAATAGDKLHVSAATSGGDTLRVAAAQFQSSTNITDNVVTICRLITEVAADGAEAVAFYEAAVTSYNASFIATVPEARLVQAADTIRATCAAHSIYCIVGTPWFVDGVRFNVALFIDPTGTLVGVQPKTMLVGDDVSWAQPGQSLGTFPIVGRRQQAAGTPTAYARPVALG